ncbi:unnamed protein product [Gordionus sp. m RMFG-2023]
MSSNKYNPKISLCRKRSTSNNNNRCNWVETTFKHRECNKFIPSLYPLSVDPANRKCGCGQDLNQHSVKCMQDFDHSKSEYSKYYLENDPEFPTLDAYETKKSPHPLNLPLNDGLGGINSWHTHVTAPKSPPELLWNPIVHTSTLHTNAFGTIEFQGISHRHNAQYIRLSYDTPPESIAQLMISHWGIEFPKLLISIHGGLSNFELSPKLSNLFQKGLVKAAKTTVTWMLTTGLNTGYVKYVGNSLNDMPYKNRSNLVTIGIAPWGVIQNKEDLIGRDRVVQCFSIMPHSPNTFPLNSHHSYFLLVDDGTTGKYGAEVILRRNLEYYLMQTNVKQLRFPICCSNAQVKSLLNQFSYHYNLIDSHHFGPHQVNQEDCPIKVEPDTKSPKISNDKNESAEKIKSKSGINHGSKDKLSPHNSLCPSHYYHTLPLNTLRQKRHPVFSHHHRLSPTPQPLNYKQLYRYRGRSSHPLFSNNQLHKGYNYRGEDMLKLQDPSSAHHKRSLMTSPANKRHSYPESGRMHTPPFKKTHSVHKSIDEMVPIVGLILNGGIEVVKRAMEYICENVSLSPCQTQIHNPHLYLPSILNNQKKNLKSNKMHHMNHANSHGSRFHSKSQQVTSCHYDNFSVPIVVVEGSGGMADIICCACNFHIDPMDNSFTDDNTNIIAKMISSQWSMDPNLLQIIISDIYVLAKNKKLITIHKKTGSMGQDLDQDILCALLKIHNKRPLDQLHLALTWNRADIAKTEIFVYGQQWPEGALENAMMQALIHDQVDFVKLLLENGIHIKKFLTIARLEKLYNSKFGPPNTLHYLIQDVKKNIPRLNYWYTMIDIGYVIDRLMGGVYRCCYGRRRFKSIYFPSKQNNQCHEKNDDDIETLGTNNAHKTQSNTLLPPPNIPEFMTSISNYSIQLPSTNWENEQPFLQPYHDLMIWAVLTQRQTTSLYFWEMGDEPLPKALMATKLYKSIGQEAAQDDLETDMSEKCQSYAKQYAKLALELLEKCFQTKQDYTEQLLTYHLKHFSDQTCLSLAVAANHLEFIAHNCCQFLLGDLWMGGLRVRKSSGIKILMGLFLPCTILTLEFKTLAELQLMPQTLEEHINDLEQETDDNDENESDNESANLENDFFNMRTQDFSEDVFVEDDDNEINFDKSPIITQSAFRDLRKDSSKHSYNLSHVSLPSTTPLEPPYNTVDYLPKTASQQPSIPIIRISSPPRINIISPNSPALVSVKSGGFKKYMFSFIPTFFAASLFNQNKRENGWSQTSTTVFSDPENNHAKCEKDNDIKTSPRHGSYLAQIQLSHHKNCTIEAIKLAKIASGNDKAVGRTRSWIARIIRRFRSDPNNNYDKNMVDKFDPPRRGSRKSLDCKKLSIPIFELRNKLSERKISTNIRKMNKKSFPRISTIKLPNLKSSQTSMGFPSPSAQSMLMSSSTTMLNAKTKFYEFYNAPITKFCSANILRDSIFALNRTLLNQDASFYFNYQFSTPNQYLNQSYPDFILKSHVLKGQAHVFLLWTEIFVIAYIFTFACEKVREAISSEAVGWAQKSKLWFYSFWNIVCLMGFILFFIGLMFKLAAADRLNRFYIHSWRAHRRHDIMKIDVNYLFRIKTLLIWSRFFNALSAIFWYVRILDILSCNKYLGPYVVMIGKMMLDMMIFVMIMIVVMASFGMARYSIRNPSAESSWTLIKDIFYQPYWMMYGEVFAPDINPECGSNGVPCITGDWISPGLMALYLLVTNILLVNLLIAVFNHTFLKVSAISQQIWKFGRFDLTIEYEMKPILPPPLIVFCHLYRLFKYFWNRKRYGYSGIEANFDYGLKLYLSEEEVNKLHEFEKCCLDDLIGDKSFLLQSTIEKQIARALDQFEDMSSRIDYLYNKQQNINAMFTNFDKRLHNLDNVTTTTNHIHPIVNSKKNYPQYDPGIIYTTPSSNALNQNNWEPSSPITSIQQKSTPSLNRLFVMRYKNSHSNMGAKTSSPKLVSTIKEDRGNLKYEVEPVTYDIANSTLDSEASYINSEDNLSFPMVTTNSDHDKGNENNDDKNYLEF